MYHVKLYKVVARSFDKAVRRHTTVVYILSKYFRKSIMHKLIKKKKIHTVDNDWDIHL